LLLVPIGWGLKPHATMKAVSSCPTPNVTVDQRG